METFTVEQIKKYILSQDSLGDVLYNLSAENIKKANEPKKIVCDSCGFENEPEAEKCEDCEETLN